MAKPLQIWTADSTSITADTVNFTADGADLINGGGAAIIEPVNHGARNRLAYTVTAQLPN